MASVPAALPRHSGLAVPGQCGEDAHVKGALVTQCPEGDTRKDLHYSTLLGGFRSCLSERE